MVDAIQSSLIAPNTDTSTSEGASTVLNQDFDTFLTLLTTQLQNQDPLDPTDTNEFTNQLVQFSQVEQQIQMNEKLESLENLTNAVSTQSALTYVGKNIRVVGNSFPYEGEAVELVYNLPENASKAETVILNSAGSVVYKANIPTSAGRHTFEWDGTNQDGETVPFGDYTMEVAAQGGEGNVLTVDTAVSGRVKGVQILGDGVNLLMGDFGVPIESVLEVRE